MHGLVSETSICYWQGQPESYDTMILRDLHHDKMRVEFQASW
jgi:hypothetical protein